jgi:hypothetical protein
VCPPEPIYKTLRLNSPTPEKTVQTSAENPRGLLYFRDEFFAWYSGMNQYTGGKGSERAMWLEATNGRQFRSERVKDGNKPTVAERFLVSMVGGIQPDRADIILQGPEDGLSARFIPVWPETPKLKKEIDNSYDNSLVVEHLKELALLDWMNDDRGNDIPLDIPLSKDAKEAFLSWRKDRHERECGEGAEERYGSALDSVFGKCYGQVLSLALILEHLWWCEDMFEAETFPKEISLKAIEAAILFREQYMKPMQLRAFNKHSESDLLNKARRAVRIFVSKNLKSITKNELKALNALGRYAAEREEIIEYLEDTGWLKKQVKKTKGRPVVTYKVNESGVQAARKNF